LDLEKVIQECRLIIIHKTLGGQNPNIDSFVENKLLRMLRKEKRAFLS